MNGRIKELALKAYNNTGQGTPEALSSFMEVYSEKFAELIVQECAEICTDPYHLGDAGTGDGFGITTADKRCAELIKNILELNNDY